MSDFQRTRDFSLKNGVIRSIIFNNHFPIIVNQPVSTNYSNRGHGTRNNQAFQSITSTEGIRPNRCHTFWNNKLFYLLA